LVNHGLVQARAVKRFLPGKATQKIEYAVGFIVLPQTDQRTAALLCRSIHILLGSEVKRTVVANRGVTLTILTGYEDVKRPHWIIRGCISRDGPPISNLRPSENVNASAFRETGA